MEISGFETTNALIIGRGGGGRGGCFGGYFTKFSQGKTHTLDSEGSLCGLKELGRSENYEFPAGGQKLSKGKIRSFTERGKKPGAGTEEGEEESEQRTNHSPGSKGRHCSPKRGGGKHTEKGNCSEKGREISYDLISQRGRKKGGVNLKTPARPPGGLTGGTP